MSDPTSGMASSDALPGPAPVAKDDPGLAELRALARKQGRTLRWSAIGLALVALLFPPVALFADPVQTAQALGRAQQVTAVVESVQLSDAQPRRERNRPAWTVWVSWPASNGVRRGTDDIRSTGEPFEVGQSVTVHTLEGEREVSLQPTRKIRAVGVLVLVAFMGLVGSAVASWSWGRRWPARVDVVTRVPPERVGVQRVVMNSVEGIAETADDGPSVFYRPVNRVGGGGDFGADHRQDGAVPNVGDVLDVWSLPQNQRGPFAVRRVSDGLWWTGRGPDPVPSIPAR